ncbi:Isochorismatase hydrolase [Saccharata proteae CBS 121410]|uniref:Isochorismatase hydrolase n=1 Tax=Saccharata proteae CBS 121410 TaxID=1314787 RepID=A0A9P4M2Y2_9PEZI|nr:Isochorismatase hydrolase [Saccharata proteae CBS 121410]
MPKTALLIIDMQNFFAPMTTSALPNILTLARAFRAAALPIFYTQHGHPPSDFQEPITNQLVRRWGEDGCIKPGTRDWAFQTEIQELVDADVERLGEEDVVVAKNTYDAFLGATADPGREEREGLAGRLRKRGVGRVVVCGTMTDCCVDTTGRSAFDRGWETWVVGDACGTVDELQQERGLGAFGYAFGEVVGTEVVVRRMREEGG